MKTFVKTYHLYREGDNPCFGESVISVEVEDNAGGPYLKIGQCSDVNIGEIFLDIDEIEPLFDLLVKIKENLYE